MGAYSTLRVTRTTARAMFLRAVLNPTDEQMEGLLDTILEPGLRNVRIVPDGEENDDAEAMAAQG